MNNLLLIEILLIASCFCDPVSVIELENGSTLMNLDKLTTLDVTKLDCSQNLLQVSHQLKMWSELFKDEKVIHHEIQLLQNAEKVLQQQQFNRHRASNTVKRANKVLTALKHNTHKRQHTLYQEWRQKEIGTLKQQINLLQTSLSEDDSKQCCDRIEKIINKYLEERKHIAKQCHSADITINIINDSGQKIDLRNEFCKKSSQKPQQVIVGQHQEEKKVIHSDDFDGHVKGDQQHGEEVSHDETQEQKVGEYLDGVVHGDAQHEDDVESKDEDQKAEEASYLDGVVHGDAQYEDDLETQDEDVKTEEGSYLHGEIDGDAQYASEEEIEEVTVTETVTKTTTTKIVGQPDDEEDDQEVVGETVQTSGVAASGEGGRQ